MKTNSGNFRMKLHKILSSILCLVACSFWVWASDNMYGGKVVGMLVGIPSIIYFVYGNVDLFCKILTGREAL